MKAICANCGHYDAQDGKCHRMPPAPMLIKNEKGETGAVSMFPPVDPAQWCGEWRSKIEKVWVQE